MNAGAGVQVADRWRLGPLAMGIEAAAFADWIATAVPGEWILYATGPVLPRSLAVVDAVTAAREAGRVSTHQRRVDGRVEYIAVRLQDVPGGVPLGDKASGPLIVADSDEARVLALLSELAADGRPCPTDAVIAIALDLDHCRRRSRMGGTKARGAERARYLVRKLAALGLITVTPPADPRGRRVVTIVATGARTAGGAK